MFTIGNFTPPLKLFSHMDVCRRNQMEDYIPLREINSLKENINFNAACIAVVELIMLMHVRRSKQREDRISSREINSLKENINSA